MPKRSNAFFLQPTAAGCSDGQRYRDLVETSNELIWSVDAQGRWTFLNERACLRILGYAPDEMLGRSFTEFVPSDKLDEALEHFEGVMAGEDRDQSEASLLRKDGRELRVRFNAMLVLDDQGRPAGATGTAIDITDHHTAMAAIREREERLRLALEAGRMGHWDYDFRTRAVLRSDAACRIYGFDPTELQPSHEALLQHVHPEDRGRLREANENAVYGRTAYSVEYRLLGPEGAIRWLSEQGRVHFDPAGEPLRMLGVVMDVTERKAMEEQLNLSRRLESIGALAGGVAHDFNNILTAVMLYAELAETSSDAGPEAREYAGKIRSAAERASNLTTQLLAFARKQIIRPEVVDLNELAARTGDMLSRLLGECIELSVRLSNDLWPVRVDPTQIEHVLLNLAINARDAMPEGGILCIQTRNLTVGPGLRHNPGGLAPGDYVLVTVRDTGVGMTEADCARAFEPFFTTKPAGKGTGLGLASCYGMVKQNGGEIWVESERGCGTTFSFCLPRTAAEGVSVCDEVLTMPESQASATVLLVEDEGMVRETAASALTSRGYRVIEARDGQEALRLAEEMGFGFDLLLTDVVMPRMGGIALAERVRGQNPGMPVLFVSGHSERNNWTDGLRAPRSSFLQKPYTSASLTAAIVELLSLERLPDGSSTSGHDDRRAA